MIYTNTTFFFSKSGGEGQHWFSILRSDEDTVEVFDSLGASPQFLQQCLSKYGGTCVFNEVKVQDTRSDKCGGFVLYYLVNRLLNIDCSAEEVFNDLFVRNTSENEKRVEEFLSLVKP